MPAKQAADAPPRLPLGQHHSTAAPLGRWQIETAQSISPAPAAAQVPLYFGG